MRLEKILKETITSIYAFALIPNHVHLLLRRNTTPISTVMRRLLTGYALYFNKRQRRYGYLFQNRYKAIICQESSYFLELVRYIHLNPIRAHLMTSIEELNCYPFSGHSYLVGKEKSDWFDTDAVLSHFGKVERRAKSSYLTFVSDGLSMGRQAKFTGGGLKRSLGHPKEYPKTREAFDDRILGEGGFVEAVLAAVENQPPTPNKRPDFNLLLYAVCKRFDVSEAELLGKTRIKPVANARAVLAYRMSKEIGLSRDEIARLLSMTGPGAIKAIRKGAVNIGNT